MGTYLIQNSQLSSLARQDQHLGCAEWQSCWLWSLPRPCCKQRMQSPRIRELVSPGPFLHLYLISQWLSLTDSFSEHHESWPEWIFWEKSHSPKKTDVNLGLCSPYWRHHRPGGSLSVWGYADLGEGWCGQRETASLTHVLLLRLTGPRGASASFPGSWNFSQWKLRIVASWSSCEGD